LQKLKVLFSLALFSIVFSTVVINTLSINCGFSPRKIALIYLSKIESALHEYKLDTGTYPVKLEQLIENSSAAVWLGPYIKRKELVDPWGGAYQYQLNADHQSYVLFSLGSDRQFAGKELATDMVALTRSLN